MNKKKILLSVTVTSMIAIAGTVLAINGGLKSLSAFATNNEVWHHYAAVAPTETTHGSKEFWASSTDGCATHTFTDPGVTCIDHDFSTYDSFETLALGDDRYVPSLFDHRNAVYPELNSENNTIAYGIYPQTNVNDEDLITALETIENPESNGWYLYEGEYYAKVNATPYDVGYKFDNGTTIVDGTTYWFKCEPITWNVLSNSNGEYYILSSVLLDAHRYDDDSNNYKDSEIRSFLNNDFYNSAFALGNSYIQTTIVDNSASTTEKSNNPYACENTNDKVFLPSYQDYINSSYGFLTSTGQTDTRCCRTTDWARARGALYRAYLSSYYNGFYWTRSPYSGYSDTAWRVKCDGSLNYGYVYSTDYSVRPGLTLSIA